MILRFMFSCTSSFLSMYLRARGSAAASHAALLLLQLGRECADHRVCVCVVAAGKNVHARLLPFPTATFPNMASAAWHAQSWKQKALDQPIPYPDEAALHQVLHQLSRLPPITSHTQVTAYPRQTQ